MDPRETGVNRSGRTRRRVLALAAAATLAGCAGDDDGTTDRDDGADTDRDGGTDSNRGGGSDGDASESDADPSAPADDRWDVDVPHDPAFIANPDVEGPSDEAQYVLSARVRSHGDVNEYDRFEVAIEHVTLHTVNDIDVTVPVETDLDLTAYETEPSGDVITLAWKLGIPAGTYTALTLETTPIEIVHESDGDVTGAFEAPPTAEFAGDGGAEVFTDGALGTELTLHVRHETGGVPTFGESLSVNNSTMDVFVLDPEMYEN